MAPCVRVCVFSATQLPSVVYTAALLSSFAERILSTGWTGQSPARCSPRPPTLPPPGTTGITPRETVMARPENSIKLRARRVMMYVVPSILPHNPPPHSNIHTHIQTQKCLHCHACVLVDMNSYL